MPQPQVVYDDMPPYIPHGWKYLAFDKDGWLYVAFGPPCNECLPPTSTVADQAHQPGERRLPKSSRSASATASAATSIRAPAITGSPRTRAIGWARICRATSSTTSRKLGENFGYPHCHQGDTPDPKFAMGHKCSEFSPPALNLGPHVAPLGMKFYTGDQFPADYKNNMIMAEHGSWNRHKFQGGRLMRVTADPDGKNIKQGGVRVRLDRRRRQVSRSAQ